MQAIPPHIQRKQKLTPSEAVLYDIGLLMGNGKYNEKIKFVENSFKIIFFNE